MDEFMEKLSLVEQLFDVLMERLEIDKGGPGSGRKPSGQITTPGDKPIVVPGKPKPLYDDTLIHIGSKPVRLRGN